MFLKEVQETKKDAIYEKKYVVKGMPRYSGRAITALQKQRRLTVLYQVIISIS